MSKDKMSNSSYLSSQSCSPPPHGLGDSRHESCKVSRIGAYFPGLPDCLHFCLPKTPSLMHTYLKAFGTCHCHLVVLWQFWSIVHVLVGCTKKNLATLTLSTTATLVHRLLACPSIHVHTYMELIMQWLSFSKGHIKNFLQAACNNFL
jgi:hypothetical protein